LDDDSVSVQSQETDKQPDTSSTLSKSSNNSKEPTPQPADDVKKDSIVKESSVEKEVPTPAAAIEQERKEKVRNYSIINSRILFIAGFILETTSSITTSIGSCSSKRIFNNIIIPAAITAIRNTNSYY
jgi:hypothetical protein